MKRRKIFLSLAVMLAFSFVTMAASAAMVIKMGLGDLVGNADKVFRGTVLTKEPGTVSMGGSEFSTVVYTVSVDDALKGDFGPKPVVTLTMLGNLKQHVSTGIEYTFPHLSNDLGNFHDRSWHRPIHSH